MRTSLKLLTVGLVLVTAAVAGCSSTTAGPAGAIQDDVAVVPPPRPDGGQPMVAATQGASCADGGVCVFGDTGPGGGVVFYVASTPFSAPGTACDSNCLYLETPLYDVGGATAWCAGGPGAASGFYVDAPGTAIGSGYMNTQAMLGTTNSPPTTICAGGAAQAASTPTGGLTDWYLPAEDELQTLYDAMSIYTLTTEYGVVFGANPPAYWGSTAYSANYAKAYCQNFNMGNPAECDKTQDAAGVHQVRAF